jgi:hypothetical protein
MVNIEVNHLHNENIVEHNRDNYQLKHYRVRFEFVMILMKEIVDLIRVNVEDRLRLFSYENHRLSRRRYFIEDWKKY